jgi:hypothetical protein
MQDDVDWIREKHDLGKALLPDDDERLYAHAIYAVDLQRPLKRVEVWKEAAARKCRSEPSKSGEGGHKIGHSPMVREGLKEEKWLILLEPPAGFEPATC